MLSVKTQCKLINVLCRTATESNDNHDTEITAARKTAEEDVLKNMEEIIKHIECMCWIVIRYLCIDVINTTFFLMFYACIIYIGTSREEVEAVTGILETTKAQATILETLQNDHSTHSGVIEQKAHDTFQQKYLVS